MFSQLPAGSSTPGGAEFAEKGGGNTWSFVFKIEPPTIITDPEHPQLEGTQDKRHDVPGAGKPYASDPTNALRHADEACLKWDTSRRMQWAGTITLALPSDPVEGNDDAFGHNFPTKDEDDDPYNAYSLTPSLAHAVGEISSTDGPGFRRANNQATTDKEVYRKTVDFQEFARVQLWDGKRSQGKYWFRVSDYVKWHHYFHAKFNIPLFFGSSHWDDDGSNDGQP